MRPIKIHTGLMTPSKTVHYDYIIITPNNVVLEPIREFESIPLPIVTALSGKQQLVQLNHRRVEIATKAKEKLKAGNCGGALSDYATAINTINSMMDVAARLRESNREEVIESLIKDLTQCASQYMKVIYLIFNDIYYDDFIGFDISGKYEVKTHYELKRLDKLIGSALRDKKYANGNFASACTFVYEQIFPISALEMCDQREKILPRINISEQQITDMSTDVGLMSVMYMCISDINVKSVPMLNSQLDKELALVASIKAHTDAMAIVQLYKCIYPQLHNDVELRKHLKAIRNETSTIAQIGSQPYTKKAWIDY